MKKAIQKTLSSLMTILLVLLSISNFSFNTFAAADTVDTYRAAVRYADADNNTKGAESTGLRFLLK